jgi:glycosyltransferase involved in cell wall biosynthesis
MSRPQRVIHIITGLGQGGAEAMLEKLLHAGRRLEPSIEQEVISLGEMGTVGQRLKAAGFTVRALGLSRRLANPWVLVRLWLWLRHAPRDAVVQTWMYHGDLIGGLAARAAGLRKVVWNVRQAGLDVRLAGRATHLVMRACARMSAWLPRVVVTNTDAAIAAHTAFGYTTERFHFIPNGFDMQAFAPDATARTALRADWQVAADELLVGVVARNDPQKDLPGFVQMAAHLARHVPNVRFVMVGRGVPSAPDVNAAIDALNLRARFTLCEQRSDIAAVHSALDIFCLSSLIEGFPNVLGEAMACATPSVSTACGDAPQILGEPLHVAPAGQPEALARCIMRVAALDGASRKALGMAQRERIASQFSIDSVWWQYSCLWRGL